MTYRYTSNDWGLYPAVTTHQGLSSIDVNALGNTAEQAFEQLPTLVQFQNGTEDLSTVAGSADDIILTRANPTKLLLPGTSAEFFATATNTTYSTVNLDDHGVKSLTTNAAVVLAGGEIVIGGWYKIVYDGTQFRIVE